MDELIRELEERRDSAQQILGDEHPLTQFIRNALESGDLQLLQAAKAACDGGHEMLHPWTNLREPTREELLEECARKPVRCFLQVDGWEDEHSGDPVVNPDEEGHVLMSGMRYQLRNTDFPMRVQIYEGSDKEAVLTLLSKAHTWLERGWEKLTTPSSSQTPDKQRTEEERIVRSEEQSTEEQRSVPNEMQPAPPPEVREPVDGDTEPPNEPGRSFLSASAGDSQAQALLERVFVLNVDMVKLDPEEVARDAADRPKYIEAYIEVADQGIEWFTRFRDTLVTLRGTP
jgi:hypothetical protein